MTLLLHLRLWRLRRELRRLRSIIQAEERSAEVLSEMDATLKLLGVHE